MPRHRERGPKRYEYTVETIAAAAGLAVSTVRQHTAPSMRTGSGFDPANLRELAGYLQKYGAATSRPLSDGDFLTLAKIDQPRARVLWPERWPVFQPFVCAAEGCPAVLFEAGFCAEHGGARRPSIILGRDDYFEILTGEGYMPYHRLAAGNPPGLDVHHVDENKWNNRPENLKAMPHGEHFALHRSVLARD